MLAVTHQGAVKRASRNTPPIRRTDRSTSESASISRRPTIRTEGQVIRSGDHSPVTRIALCSAPQGHRQPGQNVPTNTDDQFMITNVKEMIESANASVPRINAAQAKELIAKGALIVDVRDAQEIAQSGKIAGAISVSRGMLEFRADPASPYHDKNFDIERTLILYCASGGRSALGASTLKDMGYARVYNLGAFKDW